MTNPIHLPDTYLFFFVLSVQAGVYRKKRDGYWAVTGHTTNEKFCQLATRW